MPTMSLTTVPCLFLLGDIRMVNPKELGLSLELDPDGHGSIVVDTSVHHGPEVFDCTDIIDPTSLLRGFDDLPSETRHGLDHPTSPYIHIRVTDAMDTSGTEVETESSSADVVVRLSGTDDPMETSNTRVMSADVMVRPSGTDDPTETLGTDVLLPKFLMRFLATHNTCLAQINPRGIRHLIGVDVLSRECGVDISLEQLSSLLDFRVRRRSDELKNSVTSALNMTLIAGFPSKDDHFEDRFFFVEISEKTVETDCIDLVKTRWERIGRKRVSSPERVKLKAAAAAKTIRSTGSGVRRSVTPMTPALMAASAHERSSTTTAPKTPATKTLRPPSSLTLDELAMRHTLSEKRAISSSGKGKGIDRGTPSKRQRVDIYPAAVVEREALASRVAAPSLFLLFDLLVGDYDEDVRSRDDELREAKEANTIMQSRLDEFAERNMVLERDALSVQKSKKENSASDLQSTRISEVVVAARDEMARGFEGVQRVLEVPEVSAADGDDADVGDEDVVAMMMRRSRTD
ncbi:hypothetical protein AALP_AA7G154700 [Arabis alpina]|uniref:Uncharacterized protein n=1 Tax=Arabis alpina TaxID=50452 RepID=A0A087GI93_ARAAL|nr:hypothetical protein AALP_AA7G154700 [Arabis alpina]